MLGNANLVGPWPESGIASRGASCGRIKAESKLYTADVGGGHGSRTDDDRSVRSKVDSRNRDRMLQTVNASRSSFWE